MRATARLYRRRSKREAVVSKIPTPLCTFFQMRFPSDTPCTSPKSRIFSRVLFFLLRILQKSGQVVLVNLLFIRIYLADIFSEVNVSIFTLIFSKFKPDPQTKLHRRWQNWLHYYSEIFKFQKFWECAEAGWYKETKSVRTSKSKKKITE